jgi:hypothetical protein
LKRQDSLPVSMMWARWVSRSTTAFASGAGRGRVDQVKVDHDLAADQWLGAPVHRDEAEQAVLNDAPFD